MEADGVILSLQRERAKDVEVKPGIAYEGWGRKFDLPPVVIPLLKSQSEYLIKRRVSSVSIGVMRRRISYLLRLIGNLVREH